MKGLPPGISLRKDGLYMWRFKYNGQQYTGYSHKLADAKKDMRNKRYEVEHGLYSKEKDITFDAWFTEWIGTYKAADCKASTLEFYRNTYKRYIKPEFGKRKVKAIRPEQIQKFTNGKAADYSKSTASTINFLMYDSLQQAARMGIIARNPMENTTPPKYQKRQKRGALTADQEILFLEAVKDCRYYPIYRAATLSGMRIGELLGLEWHNVDFDREEIRVRTNQCYTVERGLYLDVPKSAAGIREIPMHKGGELYQLMKDHRMRQRLQRLKVGEYWKPKEDMKALVFATDTGQPIYSTNVRAQLRETLKRLEAAGHQMPACSFHTLRHCFATRCIEAGMDHKTLQAILGHSTFSMTMDLYCDVMEETKRQAMKDVEKAL